MSLHTNLLSKVAEEVGLQDTYKVKLLFRALTYFCKQIDISNNNQIFLFEAELQNLGTLL